MHKLLYGDVPNAVISDILFLNEQQNVDEFMHGRDVCWCVYVLLMLLNEIFLLIIERCCFAYQLRHMNHNSTTSPSSLNHYKLAGLTCALFPTLSVEYE